MTFVQMDRRSLLRFAAGGGVAAFVGTAAAACNSDDDDATAGTSAASATAGGGTPSAAGTTPTTPETRTTLTSKNGLLDAKLVIASGIVGTGAAQRWAITVNGETPGPTLRIRPGDHLRLVVDNKLAHSTNIHTHGLRVSPSGNADNPFIEIKAGASFTYDIDVPKDHPGGLFWYHPHFHHHVAEQLASGFFGAIIVEDDADALPALANATERLVLLQDTSLPKTEQAAMSVVMMDQMQGREAANVLLTGQLKPVVAAKAGSLERWRVLNASPSRFYRLKLDGHQFAVAGTDGGRIADPKLVDSVTIVPGERLELLVQVQKAGDFTLRTEAVTRGAMGAGAGGNRITSPAADLATFKVEGAAGTAALPALTSVVPSLAKSTSSRTREVILAMSGGGGGGGANFTIDGRQFDGARTDVSIRLGTTEEWLVRNTSPMDHPFHLHIWPFQVLEQSAAGALPVGWKDVVNVPANGYVRLHIPFTQIPGRTVFHCHILDHEDLGMMATIEVSA